MKLIFNTRLPYYLIVFYLFSSCASKKKFIYFNSTIPLSVSESNKNYNPVFKSDDLLSIYVTSSDAESVKPFNLQVNSLYQNNIGGYNVGAPAPPSFLVDPEGNIDYPILGKIKVAGLSRTQTIDLLKEKLKIYINDPVVILRINNFKVTVLGEVRNPGTYTIPNERITLLEAIGLAGDLTINGIRKNVLIVRDSDGKKSEFRIDLTSKDLFSSPVYYLQQNDLVYVEPNRAKINSSVINPSNAGIVISTISLLVSVLVLLTRK